ncbi:hypothetical protein [Stutzerimonas nitrititolerans]|nr:hypothetical protein [Stutzerimonas nitrititolerans]
MTYTLDLSTEFEMLQAKAEAALNGYRYLALKTLTGWTVRYWR